MAKRELSITGIVGRNGIDPPHLIPENQCQEAWNVEFTDGGFCKKRNGEAAHGTTSFLTTEDPYFGWRHVPGADQSAAEMWIVYTGASTAFLRLAAGTTWATVTPSPADTFSVQVANAVSAASFNGKSFIAANTTLNRLHVWDGTTLRRVGLAPTGTPTVVESAGAVTDVRKYKTAVTRQVSSVTVQRSELSEVSATITLATERATVTRVSPPGEGETHWELYAASDDDNYATYRLIATTAIATTTAEDNNADLSTFTDFEPTVGHNYLPPSCKYVISDGNRLLMAGAWESSAGTAGTTPRNSRVWFTPQLGTTTDAYYDDERVSHTSDFKSWVDVGENDGDNITGLGVLNGVVYVFKNERTYRLRPTGDAQTPYLVEEVSKSIGSVAHNSVVIGEDADGNAALYWWSHRGPYRAGVRGIEYLGHDIEDQIRSTAGSISIWSMYYPLKQQVYFYGVVASPANLAVLHIRKHRDGIGGWALWDLSSDTVPASIGFMFSATPGASMSLDLKPWLLGLINTTLVKMDTGTSAERAYLDSRVYAPTNFKDQFIVKPPTLVAKVSSNVTVRAYIHGDYRATADRSDDVGLTGNTGIGSGAADAAGTETRIIKKYDALELSGIRAFHIRIGDATAVSSAWTLDHLSVPYEVNS